MNIPDKRAYELLLEANTELIIDHQQHTDGDMEKAKKLIQKFKDLYFGNTTDFGGVRHYVKKEYEKKIQNNI